MLRKSAWMGASAALFACSCATTPRTADIDASPAPIIRTEVTYPAGNATPVSRDGRSGIRGQSPDADDDASTQPEGVARIASPRVDRRVVPAGYSSPRDSAPRVSAVKFTPAEPRGPVDCPTDPSLCPPGAPCAHRAYGMPGGSGPCPQAPWVAMPGVVPPVSYPRLYPDEYVCDGGDLGLPVHYDDYFRRGLETEDTIGEYVDSDGVFRMKPSTRVCIYAPRFGAMRTVTGPQADTKIDRLASAMETTYGAGLRNRDVTTLHNQRQGTDRLLVRSRLSGLEGERKTIGAHQATTPAGNTKLINTFQDILFLRTGQFAAGEEAWIAARIQAAVAWNRNENPVVAAKIIGGQEVIAKFKPMEIIGKEDKRKPGCLRIIKLADKKIAEPGDVVTFTIRFDNLGDLDVTQVRIVDNLSPRLEYIADSATSDRDGDVTVDDNGEGSIILTINLDDPVPGHKGGVITFRATVR